MIYILEYMNRELPTLKVKEVISKHGLDTQAQTQIQVYWLAVGHCNYHTDANNNDEYKANIGTVITSAGTYYYASRFSIDGGADLQIWWLFIRWRRLWDGSTYVSGVLTINSNVAPVLTDISNQTMTEDNALSLNIAATDADNDQLTYTITGGSSETVSAPQ